GPRAAERVHKLAAGASWRPNDWLAIGASRRVSRAALDETRRVWAGFAGREPVGDAARDVTIALAGDDAFVPGFAAGALIAPVDAPVELAASVSGAASAHVSGAATA